MNKNIKILFLLFIIVSVILVSGLLNPDSDKDGHPDKVDDFPNDARYYNDADKDGYADEIDAFPTDGKYHKDSDGDGYADEIDAFPKNSKYHRDSDSDGYADEVDAFPGDSNLHSENEKDSDNDGYTDIIDAFPKDKRYHLDSDNDGYADEVDAFPKDSKYHLDSDSDGYADEVDAFPRDSRYHSDYDKDGYADEVDEYPYESSYHAKCSNCNGAGIIIKSITKSVKYNVDATNVQNKGLVNPDYYFYITLTNIDSHEGTFSVTVNAEDNGVKMWEDRKSFFIGSGKSYEFIFNYDADEDMDSFGYYVTAPTYVEKYEETCSNCGGTGKR